MLDYLRLLPMIGGGSLSLKANERERERVSKIKRQLEDWLIDNQINGDDGTGFEDYKTEEEEK